MPPQEDSWRDYLREVSSTYPNSQLLGQAEQEGWGLWDFIWGGIKYPDQRYWNSYLNERFNKQCGLLTSSTDFARICEETQREAGGRSSEQVAAMEDKMASLVSEVDGLARELLQQVQKNSKMDKGLRNVLYKLGCGTLSHRELLYCGLELISPNTAGPGSRVRKRTSKSKKAVASVSRLHTGPSSGTRSSTLKKKG